MQTPAWKPADFNTYDVDLKDAETYVFEGKYFKRIIRLGGYYRV